MILRDAANRDVAVGDHADQSVLLGHRKRADIGILHLDRRIAQRVVGPDRPHVLVHDLADFHSAHLLSVVDVESALRRARGVRRLSARSCRASGLGG
jgi:hypothetical protein